MFVWNKLIQILDNEWILKNMLESIIEIVCQVEKKLRYFF